MLKSKNIILREIEVQDADFVLELRTNANKSKFLHKTENNLQKQVDYIEKYKQKTDEWYFIIQDFSNQKLGTVRIYDIKDDSFCWGSWLVKDNAPISTGIESALLVYKFAYEIKGFKKSHFDVRKNNERVIAFHKRMKAKIVSEDDLNYYFHQTIKDYMEIKSKYKKYL